MRLHDETPVFPDGATATAARNEGGEWVLSFDEAAAAPGYIVHDYLITIVDEKGKIVLLKNYINDYYVIDNDSTAHFRIGTDTLESGKSYTAVVFAESAYHKFSKPLRVSFTAQ